MAEPVAEIREKYRAASEDVLPSFIAEYQGDKRNGVQILVRSAQKKLDALSAERERIRKTREFERQAAGDYLTGGFLCGIDEAGRGPLAGPVAAGAVILPADQDILYINDSKKLSPDRRAELYERITAEAVTWAVGLVSPERIDEINILQATYEAMRLAVSKLYPQPEVLVIDAVRIPGLHIPQVPVVKGDAKCLSVGAASILAKVTRDRIMMEYDRAYPEYGFAENKGYGSAEHIAALKKYGPCPIHRKTFIGHFVTSDLHVNRGRNPGQESDFAGDAVQPGEPGEDRLPESRRNIGTREEFRAAEFLREHGVNILEHSFHAAQGEIDLIGRDSEGTLLFLEVKYRSSDRRGTPEEAVTGTKQKTICRVSDYYRCLHGIPDTARIRYDVVAMDADGIRWIRNAFPYRGR